MQECEVCCSMQATAHSPNHSSPCQCSTSLPPSARSTANPTRYPQTQYNYFMTINPSDWQDTVIGGSWGTLRNEAFRPGRHRFTGVIDMNWDKGDVVAIKAQYRKPTLKNDDCHSPCHLISINRKEILTTNSQRFSPSTSPQTKYILTRDTFQLQSAK